MIIYFQTIYKSPAKIPLLNSPTMYPTTHFTLPLKYPLGSLSLVCPVLNLSSFPIHMVVFLFFLFSHLINESTTQLIT